MKKYLIIVLMASFLAIGETYGEEEVYYCAKIDNNGFHYNEASGKYERTGFFTEKFKMKLDTDSSRIVLAFDDRKDSYTCTRPHSPTFAEQMSCVSDFYHFNFNTKTGRFVYSLGGGYMAGDGDTISISYGKCDQF